MYLPEFGARLKTLRKQRDLTQSALGSMVGVSKAVISSYENDMHYPPYDVLLSFSRIFGVSTDYLLGAEKHSMISVDGLSEVQIRSLTNIVEELKSIK